MEKLLYLKLKILEIIDLDISHCEKRIDINPYLHRYLFPNTNYMVSRLPKYKVPFFLNFLNKSFSK